jgi:hypothetical protein
MLSHPNCLSTPGPLARIGPNTLTTNSVEQFHRMSAPRSLYTRSEWYLGFRLAPGVDNAFSMRDDKMHAKRRAQMNMGVRMQTTQPHQLLRPRLILYCSIRERKTSISNRLSTNTLPISSTLYGGNIFLHPRK